MTIKYNLYSSEGCHLCEEALSLFTKVKPLSDVNIIDIVEDDKLVELYGISIPVLESISSDKKLFWPFTQVDISQLT